jgi:transmembrane sensor
MDSNAPRLDSISAEAADWFARLQDPDEAVQRRAEFVEWLLRSPQHLEEFLAITRIWGDAQLASTDAYSRDALIAAARTYQQPDNIVTSVPFAGSRSSSRLPESRAHGWLGAQRLAIAAVAAAILALGGLVWFVAESGLDPSDIRTAIGEQRSVTLPDGSIVILNTDSQLHVDLGVAERHIDLIRGEAQFKVAKDASRPFIVSTREASVRAIGTIFNVYAGSERTEVAVLEGRIELRDLAARSGPATRIGERIELTAGQQAAVVAEGDIVRNVEAPIERATAWIERRLVFRQQTLADVVAEFNRYHERPIRTEDAALAGVRISGTFDSSDPRSLLEYLERFENVRIEERPDGIYVLRHDAQ